jgi:aspartyl/asparaginyl beta-hydroxylase (cupin superfamily)
MVARLLAPQILVLYWFAATALIVHFRGRDRFSFTRQPTDFSTLLAPYNVLMYWFSALPNRPVLPRSCTTRKTPPATRATFCSATWSGRCAPVS